MGAAPLAAPEVDTGALAVAPAVAPAAAEAVPDTAAEAGMLALAGVERPAVAAAVAAPADIVAVRAPAVPDTAAEAVVGAGIVAAPEEAEEPPLLRPNLRVGSGASALDPDTRLYRARCKPRTSRGDRATSLCH